MLDDISLIPQAVTILDAHHPIEIEGVTRETELTSRSSGAFVQPETAGKTGLRPLGWTIRRPLWQRLQLGWQRPPQQRQSPGRATLRQQACRTPVMSRLSLPPPQETR